MKYKEIKKDRELREYIARGNEKVSWVIPIIPKSIVFWSLNGQE